jgi:hypothetical protein
METQWGESVFVSRQGAKRVTKLCRCKSIRQIYFAWTRNMTTENKRTTPACVRRRNTGAKLYVMLSTETIYASGIALPFRTPARGIRRARSRAT